MNGIPCSEKSHKASQTLAAWSIVCTLMTLNRPGNLILFQAFG